MQALLKLFVDLCLLRANPQDVPAAGFLFRAALAGYFLSSMAVLAVQAPLTVALGHAGLGTLVLMALVTLLLRLRGGADRFGQTLTALTGSGVVLNVLALPVMYVFVQSRIHDDVSGMPTIFLLLMILWSLAIFGHIMRHAMNISLLAGVLLGVLDIIVTQAVVNTVFPYTPAYY